MSSPRTYQTEAIIIKKTRLGEADRVLTLYTPGLGKLQAIAKGIRRPRAKLAGHLELLTRSLVTLVRGRNLDTIIGSQTIDSFLPLKTDLELASRAFYITELVHQFTVDGMENQAIYQLLLDTMRRLSRGENEALLRYFELHLLGMAGYRLELESCVSCHGQPGSAFSYFSPEAGGVLCPECSLNQPVGDPISGEALKTLRHLQANQDDIVSPISPELDRELEALLRGYIRHILEREIKSAAWMDTVRALSPVPSL